MNRDKLNYAEPKEEDRQRLINSIPEFDTVVRSKENIAQLPQGRDSRTLSSILQKSTDELLDAIEEGESKFKTELEAIDYNHDPLDVYLKHLDWIDQIFVQGQSNASPLRSVLEQVTTRFQDSFMYKNDPRYLKCWLRLSRLRSDPIKIYHHLITQNIGQMCALFYEDYASYFEKIQKYNEASQIFESGIKKKAEPIASLKRAKDAFTARQTQRRLDSESSDPSTSQLNERNQVLERSGRKPLGVLFDASAEFCKNSGNAYHFGGGLPQREREVGSSYLPIQRKYHVYSDRTEGNSQPSVNPPQSMQPYTHRSPECKENTVRSERFKGAVLPQNPYKRPKKDTFTVFKDRIETGPSTSQPLQLSQISQSAQSAQSSQSSQSFRSSQNSPKPSNKQSLRTRQMSTERTISVVEEDNLKDLTERFNAIEALCMRELDSKGKYEYISFIKNCPDNSAMLSCEEERARAAERKAKTLGIYTEDNTGNLTAETRAAHNSIGEMYKRASGLSKIQLEEDAGFYDKKWLKKQEEERRNRVYTNENEYPTASISSTSDNPMLERLRIGTFSGGGDDDDDESDDELIHKMLQREIEAGNAGNSHLISRTN
ncbi:Mad3/BUB1 homology region 1-domain-containing protein [Phycomyces blakesleeanus]|uniref:BUB1 N-terminal domain-containing protein n=2 Tax=Phycomyces blakesleeanus TaxID=4837 RepID=A0A162NEM1_PHYB8|nr:hypothetical protein PHYBLDRAFT_168039 [Phycomyces blakesleeanus NRRL 1555(-)]OAD73598.1 hypothetical protein PHYBLDRAFT_168039 [Phycomyces blakesleeanus NRRL 1555(-)]|eukprot:XP_018291638.1 hypothetical protein PHYBLDRAFT_168039 [Phycomyces blakesleeanus NRRL 1555(-)]